MFEEYVGRSSALKFLPRLQQTSARSRSGWQPSSSPGALCSLAQPLPPASPAEVLRHCKKRHIDCERLMKTPHFSPRRGHRSTAVCAVLLAVAMLSRAESTPSQQGNDRRTRNQPTNGLSQTTNRVAKKPRASEEEFWCSIIDSATAQATALEPAMRSFVLDAVAGAFKKCDPGKVRKVLVDAFAASLEIPESEEQYEGQWGSYEGSSDPLMITAQSNLATKHQLQISALQDLLAVDEAKVESLLPRAEPMVRQLLSLQIIFDAAHAGQFDKALSFLNQLPVDQAYPYSAATELMLVLPPKRNAQKQEIFQRA